MSFSHDQHQMTRAHVQHLKIDPTTGEAKSLSLSEGIIIAIMNAIIKYSDYVIEIMWYQIDIIVTYAYRFEAVSNK